MGAGGSIPADEAAAKEAGRTDDEIAIYKFTQGYKDGSAIEQCTEDAELAYPGAPPAPAALMMSITSKFGAAFPDWTSKCLSITKNDDGTYTTNEQQCCGVMKADMPVIEGFPFPEVKVEELPEEAKTAEMTFPVEVGTITMEGGKIKKAVFVGETKEGVEGAEEPTPYMKEQWAAGKGGFPAIYSFVGKPLPEAPAEEAAAAPAEEPAADAAPAAE